MTPPTLKIGSDAFVAQRFSWGFVPGPLPYIMTLRVPTAMIRKIMDRPNPVTLVFKAEGQIAGRDEKPDLTLRNLYLVQPRQTDAFFWTVEIADLRVRWRNQRVTWTANRTWRANAFGQGLVISDPNDPAALRVPFDRFQEFRYLPWSKKDQRTPWTALELLTFILSGLEYGKSPVGKVVDNGAVLEEMEWQEEPVEQVLMELCQLARVQIGVLESGAIKLYNSEEVVGDRLPHRPPLDGGVPYKQDLSRIRPSAVRVKAIKKREIMLAGPVRPDESLVPNSPIIGPVEARNDELGIPGITEEDYVRGRCAAVYNVVKVPTDTTYRNLVYQKDTWMPMPWFLDAIGLDEEFVRRTWWDNLFILHYATVMANRGLSDPPDPVRVMQGIAIKQHYRQTFQIDPYWVHRWEGWEPIRAALVDPKTRYSLPTPVWSDFTMIPSVFMPEHAKQQRAYRLRAFQYWVNEEPPEGNGEAIRYSQTYTAGALQTQDSQLGVFRVAYPQDVEQVIQEIVPTGVDNPPAVSAGGDVLLWSSGSSLRATHTFRAVISVTPALDDEGLPSDKRYFEVSVPVTNGLGPPAEVFMTEEFARYSHPAGITTENVDPAIDALVQQGAPSNVGVLITTAQVKASILLHSYVDRLSGYLTYPGIDKGKLELFGPCRGIYVEMDEASGLRTHYDMTEPPIVPNLASGLSREVRRIIYRQLGPER